MNAQVFAIFVPALLLLACRSRTGSPEDADPSRVASRAGISVPAGSKVLFADTDERKDGGYSRWILRSPSSWSPASAASTEMPPSSTLDLIARLLPRETTGKPAEEKARMFEWKNAEGSWRAVTVATDTGFWTVLERFP